VGVSYEIILLRIRASIIVLILSSGFLDAPFYMLNDGVPELSKLSAEFSPPFLEFELHEELYTYTYGLLELFFRMSWAPKAALNF
jgi:hypothetical protein